MPSDDWPQRFVAGERSLYAVLVDDLVDIIVLVDTGADAADAWRFSLRDGELREIEYHTPNPPIPSEPVSGDHYFSALLDFLVDPVSEYERYLVLPPRDDLPGLSALRRSGVAIIDALLDAAYERDEAAVAQFLSYQDVECSAPGSGAGRLQCPDGIAPGTLLNAIPTASCEGGYLTFESAARQLVDTIVPNALHSVVVTSKPTSALDGRIHGQDDPSMVVFLAGKRRKVALVMNSSGVLAIDSGCGQEDPPEITGEPEFLLPPP